MNKKRKRRDCTRILHIVFFIYTRWALLTSTVLPGLLGREVEKTGDEDNHNFLS